MENNLKLLLKWFQIIYENFVFKILFLTCTLFANRCEHVSVKDIISFNVT